MKRKREVWCVQHRDGWCAASAQIRPPEDGAGNVKTLYGSYVVLPWGIAKRQPTCPDCIAALASGDK